MRTTGYKGKKVPDQNAAKLSLNSFLISLLEWSFYSNYRSYFKFEARNKKYETNPKFK
jgi:hypothetical protein